MSAPFGEWRTLRELDAQAGVAKGTAFRAFKRLSPDWAEARDYRVLSPDTQSGAIEALRAAGRLYGASRVAILLSPGAAQQVAQFIASRKAGE
jgi:hypothetical protein